MEVRHALSRTPEVSPAAHGRLLSVSDGASPAVWQLAEEMPAAILLNGQNFAVMMLTPADLEDFAVGFAVTEGIVRDTAQIESLRIGEASDGLVLNLVVDSVLAEAVEERRRTFASRSGCGVCGAQTIRAALPKRRPVSGAVPDLTALECAYAALGPAQSMNQANRTTHAAAFCDLSGGIMLLREDIGRHNALDKLAGALAREGRNASAGFVLLSSRVSVEMVQKAAAIGAPAIAAVSAPSALALRSASNAGMAIFVRTAGGVMHFAAGKPGEMER